MLWNTLNDGGGRQVLQRRRRWKRLRLLRSCGGGDVESCGGGGRGKLRWPLLRRRRWKRPRRLCWLRWRWLWRMRRRRCRLRWRRTLQAWHQWRPRVGPAMAPLLVPFGTDAHLVGAPTMLHHDSGALDPRDVRRLAPGGRRPHPCNTLHHRNVTGLCKSEHTSVCMRTPYICNPMLNDDVGLAWMKAQVSAKEAPPTRCVRLLRERQL